MLSKNLLRISTSMSYVFSEQYIAAFLFLETSVIASGKPLDHQCLLLISPQCHEHAGH